MVESNMFYEYVYFNGWLYGTTVEQFYTDDLFIMTPAGISHVKPEDRVNSFIIYTDIDIETREIRLKNVDNKKFLLKSLNNIVNYFGKNESLSKLSLDILNRLNDENIGDNKISKVLSNISLDYPATTELLDKKSIRSLLS